MINNETHKIDYYENGNVQRKRYYFNGKLCEDPLKIAVFKAVKEGDNNEN